jgi:hypothetical protein
MSELLPNFIDSLLASSLVPVIEKVVERSLAGSAKHSEIVLKLAGLLGTDETKILQVFNKGPERDVLLTTQQIAQMIKETKE